MDASAFLPINKDIHDKRALNEENAPQTFFAKCSVCIRHSNLGNENLGRSFICIAFIFQSLNTLMRIYRNR